MFDHCISVFGKSRHTRWSLCSILRAKLMDITKSLLEYLKMSVNYVCLQLRLLLFICLLLYEHLVDAWELNAFSALKPADHALSVLLWIPGDCVLRLFSRMVNAAAKHGNLQSAEGWFRAAQESCRNDAGYSGCPSSRLC